MSSSSASTGGPEGPVIVCKSAAEFEEHVKKAAASKKLVVVDFTAAWCGPCKFIAPVFAELAKTTAHVVFLKVDVDELKDVAEKYRVEAMPTFLFIKEGNEIERVVGARKADLEAKVQQHGAYVVA